MRYKTMVFELLETYPAARERLRGNRSGLELLDSVSAELKTGHQAWMERLRDARPGSGEERIANEALEIALAELTDRLSVASEDDSGSEACSLEGAMAFIRRHTPPK